MNPATVPGARMKKRMDLRAVIVIAIVRAAVQLPNELELEMSIYDDLLSYHISDLW